MSHHHHDDHPAPVSGTLHTRREFLRTSMLGAAASWTLPLFLQKTFATLDAIAADSLIQTPNGKDGEIIVVLQLAGGNDGLNTVIPYADDAYHRARPVIGIAPNQVLRLSSYVGLHPNLTGLKTLFDQGHLGIIQGAGYPNPNRSHFRSTEIWQTASDSDKTEYYGWLGRYFDSCCKGADPTVGIAIGNSEPQSFAAETPTGISVSRPEQYRWVNTDHNRASQQESESVYRDMNRPDDPTMLANADTNSGGSIGSISGPNTDSESSLDFLQRTALDAQLSSDKIMELAKRYQSSVEYPRSQLANSLSLIAKMIAGKLPTRVYYASQGGYDTHTNQVNTHARLMTELGDALLAFTKDLQAQGNFGRVTIMTFSEFGRRVSQNASNGTDHGAAAPMFIVGGSVKPGLFGTYPSLTELFEGDLKYNVDFRSIYATLLEKRLSAPSEKVLGRKFPLMPIV